LFALAALRAQVGFRCSAHERPGGCGRTTLWQSHNGQGYWSFQPLIAASRRSRSSGKASTRSCARGTAPDCAVVALEGAAECGAGDVRLSLRRPSRAPEDGRKRGVRQRGMRVDRAVEPGPADRIGSRRPQGGSPCAWTPTKRRGRAPQSHQGPSVEKANRLGYIMP
jgi:hypothetical protein